jgi:type I restriction enzyme R subunit
VVFTTIQKFLPEEKGDRHPALSDRRNIVVIADEAHRSQYDFIDGFARHMRDALPNASFIGFTGTPIEKTDANTRAVFGDYISVYDIQRAVRTAPRCRSTTRAARQAGAERGRAAEDRPGVRGGDRGRGGRAQGEAQDQVGALEALVGDREAARARRRDLVEHFEKRLEAMDGKAMIVCMSRRICVELYARSSSCGPSGTSDRRRAEKRRAQGGDDRLGLRPADWQPHIRNKPRREALAKRFRDPKDPFRS